MYKFLFFFIITVNFAFTEVRGFVFKGDEIFDSRRLGDVEMVNKPVLYSNGILFTFDSKNAKEVFVSGDFLNWARVPLVKNFKGVFLAFINEISLPKGKYRYRYLVDGFWMDDPSQDYFISEKDGFPITGFELDSDFDHFEASPEIAGSGYFRFYLKDEGYKYVSLVGTDNRWDPFVKPMKKIKNFWTILLHVNKERTFYRFYVDGKTILDPNNKNVTFNASHEEVNFIPLEAVEESNRRELQQSSFLDPEGNR